MTDERDAGVQHVPAGNAMQGTVTNAQEASGSSQLPHWVVSLETELDAGQQSASVVLNVPDYLKGVKPSEYRPQVLFLGFNNRSSHGQQLGIDKYKLKFARQFLAWKEEEGKREYRGEDLVRELDFTDEDVLALRKMYEPEPTWAGPEAMKHDLALDALFLVLFLNLWDLDTSRHCLPIGYFAELRQQPWLSVHIREIWRDIFLLENQIPMKFLRQVVRVMPNQGNLNEEERLGHFLKRAMRVGYPFLTDETNFSLEEHVFPHLELCSCAHLLDCLLQVVCYSSTEDRVDTAFYMGDIRIPSATSLRKAGIRLTSDGCGSLDGVTFANSWLHLPKLRIFDTTECILRNLAAFEMVSRTFQLEDGTETAPFSSYLTLMYSLIDSEDDVSLLCKRAVLVNYIGTDAKMTNLWSELGSGVAIKPSARWAAILRRVEGRCKDRVACLRSEYRDTYCARPWLVASGIAALLLLLLTVVQTWFGVLSYYST